MFIRFSFGCESDIFGRWRGGLEVFISGTVRAGGS